MQDLANSVNKLPLPPLHEYYGIRLPPPSERLTQLNYDLHAKGRPAFHHGHPHTATGTDFDLDTAFPGSTAAPHDAMDLDAAASAFTADASGTDLFGDFTDHAAQPDWMSAAGGFALPLDPATQSMDQDAPGEEDSGDDAQDEADQDSRGQQGMQS